MTTDGTEFDRDQPCADHAPDENKSGQANHLLQHDRRMPEQGFHRCVDGGEVPKEEHSLPLRASKILVSLGASVNLTLATGGERYGHFRSGGEGGGIRRPGREKRRCYEPPSRDRCWHITSGRTGSQRISRAFPWPPGARCRGRHQSDPAERLNATLAKRVEGARLDARRHRPDERIGAVDQQPDFRRIAAFRGNGTLAVSQ